MGPQLYWKVLKITRILMYILTPHGLFLEGVYKIHLDTKTEYGVLGDTSHIPKRLF
jgi:hypothetical protein